jgi:hypothetical protein
MRRGCRIIILDSGELVCTRPNNNDCKLFNKSVLVDANFVINVIEILSKTVDLCHRDWRSQLNNFNLRLMEFLEKCCTCSPSNRIYTSDLISANEIAPTNPGSAIRTESGFLRRIAYEFHSASGRFFSEIHSTLQSKIESIDTEPAFLSTIRNIIPTASHLSDEDVSLIFSAIKRSNDVGETFVVTGDEGLRQALNDALSLGTLRFSSTTFRTDRILPLTECTYTSYLHYCCQLANEQQISILKFFVMRDWSRPLDETKKKKKGFQISNAFELLEDAVRIKEERGY